MSIQIAVCRECGGAVVVSSRADHPIPYCQECGFIPSYRETEGLPDINPDEAD